MTIKAVIFDMDGVIIDTPKINIEAAVMSFKEIGIELDESDKQEIVGRHPIDYNRILSKKYKFDAQEMLEKITFNFLKFYKKINLLEGVRETIFNLKKQGLVLALATSSPKKLVSIVLKKFGLEDTFKAILTFEDCRERKPAPDIYFLAAKRLCVESNSCLVFEDTTIGIQAAKSARMKCIAVPNKYTEKQDFSKADFIIKSLDKFDFKIIKKSD